MVLYILFSFIKHVRFCLLQIFVYLNVILSELIMFEETFSDRLCATCEKMNLRRICSVF